ncbi:MULTISPECIES: hypothetical protein [Halobellus]|jgi:hypothetical protein|uniref:hypothetical protein n=1 Tax=Halobellus TaxID=1073986 RepID=UPI0013146BBE|nr:MULTISPECIES: hypothetical protein [Halobellus]MDQ2054712.1 hypothetical protein [Halobellus sp. H-GB7]
MRRRTRALLVAVICLVGAGVLIALTVYPFQYGIVEGVIVAGALVVAALFETVLDDTSF